MFNRLKIEITAVSHPGKVRTENQDTIFFIDRIPEKGEFDVNCADNLKKPVLFGILDGMGGLKYGKNASLIAATALAESRIWEEKNEEDILSSMQKICFDANRRVCRKKKELSVTEMGTTLTMACVWKSKLYICNVGDSPAFIMNNGGIRKISEEHTERLMYERIHGAKAPESMKFNLTQHIGIEENEMILEPHVSIEQVQTGDWILLCSDGLTDMVPEEEIRQILINDETPGKLLDMALDRGAKDNVSFIAVRIR